MADSAVQTSTPRTYGRMLRSDLYRLWVVLGVLMAVIFSSLALYRTAGGAGAETSRELSVRLTDFTIQPATFEAPAGQDVVLEVRNEGVSVHDLVVQGAGGTKMLTPGEHESLRLPPLDPGRYELFCSVAGHREAGMTGTLVVGEGGAAAPSHGMTAEEMDELYMAGLEAFPAPTEGLGDQILEPTILDGVKVFELVASEFQWEVEPGDFRPAMGYNGVVPGPQIRVQTGDRMRVVLQNELSESTSIHFHGQNLPNDQDGVAGLTQPLVKPGESFTYEFRVDNAGTQIYHSHMNGAHQIPLGLWGAFIVEGPDDPEVDQDLNIILNDGPLGYTINGKGFPATQPILAAPGERIRIRYLNEGLQGHPMHLHGMEQLVIAKDGWPLPQPYRADTIWVAPGERYDVLVTARPGAWAFHCHILSHAEDERGMFGMVTAMIVE